MTRNVTAKGGPLHGKTYTVPDGMTSFPAKGGTYRVTAKQATWQPKDDDAEYGDALAALADAGDPKAAR